MNYLVYLGISILISLKKSSPILVADRIKKNEFDLLVESDKHYKNKFKGPKKQFKRPTDFYVWFAFLRYKYKYYVYSNK